MASTVVSAVLLGAWTVENVRVRCVVMWVVRRNTVQYQCVREGSECARRDDGCNTGGESSHDPHDRVPCGGGHMRSRVDRYQCVREVVNRREAMMDAIQEVSLLIGRTTVCRVMGSDEEWVNRYQCVREVVNRREAMMDAIQEVSLLISRTRVCHGWKSQ